MKVLVACEFSGIVREAFAKAGHDAWSCDLLPTEQKGNHIQGDVIGLLDDPSWDLIIAHPPCTDLCVSGARWMKDKWKDGRVQSSMAFFMKFVNCRCPKVAIENPVGIMSRHYRKPDQIIGPWQFGHMVTKKTCLWLKGLPLLQETNRVFGKRKFIHHMAPGPDRAKNRSRTFKGIADAMAKQWGEITLPG